MAKKLSIALLLVLLCSFVAGQGGTLAADVNETLKATCGTTPDPEVCYSVLVRHTGSYPGGTVGGQLVGQAVYEAVPLLLDASSTARDETYLTYVASGGRVPEAVTDCFANCSRTMVDAAVVLVDSFRGEVELEKTKFADVQRFLTKSREKHVQWNCDACRSGAEKKKADEVAKGSKLDKYMAVMSFFVDSILAPTPPGPPVDNMVPESNLD